MGDGRRGGGEEVRGEEVTGGGREGREGTRWREGGRGGGKR